MKLVMSVIQDEDAGPLMEALVKQEFRATKLASTGGFLLRGNTTLLIGVEDRQVQRVVDTIRQVCGRRTKLVPQTTTDIPSAVSLPIEVEAGGAIIFVVDVKSFFRV